MKRVWLFLLALILHAGIASAQLYRYLNTQSGLSSQRVISIGKDKKGYMWFLSHEGIDRFNGTEFKHYYLSDKGRHIQQLSNLSKIYTDSKGNIWSIGKNGYLFKYNSYTDQFDLIFNFTEKEYRQELLPLSIAQIDRNDRIWLCGLSSAYVYYIKSQKMLEVPHSMDGQFRSLTQIDDHTFYIGTDKGIYRTVFNGNKLESTLEPELKDIQKIEKLHYIQGNDVLVINAQKQGMMLYYPSSKELKRTSFLENVHLNEISNSRNYPDEVIIATNGEGIFRLNIRTCELQRFRALTQEDTHSMSGDIITDVFIDEMQRIWMGVYPYGVTFYSNTEPTYQWLSTPPKSMSFRYSNHVNQVIEDHEGDLWIATNRSVYLFNHKTHLWKDMLSDTPAQKDQKRHIFLSLCEYVPGKILVGGYMDGAYHIDKRTGQTIYYPHIEKLSNHLPDKYLRSFFLDRDTLLWVGGNSNLKCINVYNGEAESFPIKYPITYITAKSDNELWLGTVNGLYVLNKKEKKFVSTLQTHLLGCINTIYQPSSEVTYFGTNGSGLWIFDAKSHQFTNYNTLNSILKSNNIYSILPNKNQEELILNTEKELIIYRPKEQFFIHWAPERLLLPERFNTAAGLHTSLGQNIFVCSQGIIVLKDHENDNRTFQSKLVFSDFCVEKGPSDLEKESTLCFPNLDNEHEICLPHDENTFTMKISSINYDCPSRIQYSWKLEGYDRNWTSASQIRRINYSHLPPGEYLLRVRSVHEDYKFTIEERTLLIHIKPAFYQTFFAYLSYLILIIMVAILILTLLALKRNSIISKEKIQFFINTAHDIRTPLSLIKAPLTQIEKAKVLTQEDARNLQTAIKNTDNLTRLVNQLIEFQKEDLYSSTTYVASYNLQHYVQTRLKKFSTYLEQKHLTLNMECDFNKLNVWIDTNKMDSILNNLISNAIKYTPEGGQITITLKKHAKDWEMNIADTGIGISSKDQRKLFKYHFRGNNAINQRITGCGIGMLQTYQLVKRHAGQISVWSKENVGTTFTLTFPIKSSVYKYQRSPKKSPKKEMLPLINLPEPVPDNVTENDTDQSDKPSLLVVEDNAELRQFLCHSLSDSYQIKEAMDGVEALDIVQQTPPDIILSDIMMPILRGDELCRRIKNDIATSHIAVILLTALDDKESMLKGLSYKADSYIMKPFDIEILKGTISSIWANKLLVRERFAQMNFDTKDLEQTIPGLDLDQEFLTKATDFIMKSLDQEFNVDILCSQLNLSRTSLYTKIKALTNYSPSEFIRNIRMNEAARLLKTKQYSVSEVSDKVGYGNPKYFTDMFKKHFGVTPSAYMKEDKEQ